MVKLTAEEILSARGYHAAETVLLSSAETLRHTHEFYEIFIMKEGEVYHCCNQREELLTQDMLCLIKPEDVHSFRKGKCKSAHFMNLAFSIEAYEKSKKIWQEFYGGQSEHLAEYVRLPASLGQSLILKMMYLMKNMVHEGDIPPEGMIQEILTETFIYLEHQKTSREVIPSWLEKACQGMGLKENYLEGMERFVELSGKSQEHLTRMMKKYYGKTPSAYINAIRLEQTAALLRTTDESILNIMLECGYNNVSYFNQRFKEEYGVSPTRYRQANRLVVNPDL